MTNERLSEKLVETLNKKLKDQIELNRLLVENKEVWAICWARDCDCVESTWAQHWNSEIEFQRWVDNQAEWMEGPWSVERCTKEEYEEFEGSTRDLALENFENGRGTAVVLHKEEW